LREAALALGLSVFPPAQVHLDQLDLPLPAEPAQLGPGVGHQFVALADHVAKGRGDEDADSAVGGGGEALNFKH